MGYFYLFLLSFIVLSSCATLTKKECQSANWESIGQRDGENGADPQKQFRRHVSACQKANVIPDRALWRQGYEKGLLHYCTPMQGMVAGRQGNRYHDVCPVKSETRFLQGYLLGKQEYDVKSRIHRIERRISDLEDQIRHQREEIKSRSISNTDELIDMISGKERRDETISDLKSRIWELRLEKIVETSRFEEIRRTNENFILSL